MQIIKILDASCSTSIIRLERSALEHMQAEPLNPVTLFQVYMNAKQRINCI